MLGLSCNNPIPVSVDVAGLIEIPVVVYFPNEETREDYEDLLISGIELANVLFYRAGIFFYIDNVIVTPYDPNYNYEEDHEKFGNLYNDSIPIFFVEDINFDGKSGWSGLAWRVDHCSRFNMIKYPLWNTAVFAHELGHSLNLDHVDVNNNIMYKSLPKEIVGPLTDEQLHTMRDAAIDFVQSCNDAGFFEEQKKYVVAF